MQPSRRPGGDGNNPRSHWVNPGYNKYSPGTAPTPDPSRITRTYPTPSLLVERRQRDVAAGTDANDASISTDGDLASDAVTSSTSSAAAAAAAVVKSVAVNASHPTAEGEGDGVDGEEHCPICRDRLPDVGRGIIKCGHVFCFMCIHRWVKKQQSSCPACRAEVRNIKKTLSMPEIEYKNRDWKPPTKAQMKRAKRKSAIGKPPVRPYVIADTVRVRSKRSNETARQNRMEPHPEAPGGFMHEEEAIAASTAVESVVPSAAVLSNLGERPQQVDDVVPQQVAVVDSSPATSAAASVPLPTQPQRPQPPQPSAVEPEELRRAIEGDLEEETTARVQPTAGGDGGAGESSPNVDSGNNGHNDSRSDGGSSSEAAVVQRLNSDRLVAAPPAPPASTTSNGSNDDDTGRSGGDGGRNGRNTTNEVAAAAGGVAGGVAAVVVAATAVASPFAPVPPPPPSTAPSNSSISTSTSNDHDGSENQAIEEGNALSAQGTMGSSRAAARDARYEEVQNHMTPPPSTAPSNTTNRNSNDHNGSENPAIEEGNALSARVAMGNSRAAARDARYTDAQDYMISDSSSIP